MSGTSADGVDAALIEVHQERKRRVEVLSHLTMPYPDDLRAQVLAASEPATGNVALICHLNVAVGECFADAALAVTALAGLRPQQVDLIGSHGQTIYHIPIPSTSPPRQRSTLQIGEPCVIAERTGITTIADFRPRDMAAGGLGAPLSPYGHHVLFADPQRPKLIQNIGGIANVTVLAGATASDIIAFDTGPGNMVIDAAVSHFTHGEQYYDAGGEMASQGTVHPGLLQDALQHPFLAQAPPKATGREVFGKHFFHSVLAQAETLGLAPTDIVRTCTALTATSIAENYRRFILPRWPIAEVVVCGGGACNPVLMQMLREQLTPRVVTTPEHYGYPNEALEAILFALLAHATWHGIPTNFPSVTGAQRPVVLGKIIPAGR